MVKAGKLIAAGTALIGLALSVVFGWEWGLGIVLFVAGIFAFLVGGLLIEGDTDPRRRSTETIIRRRQQLLSARQGLGGETDRRKSYAIAIDVLGWVLGEKSKFFSGLPTEDDDNA